MAIPKVGPPLGKKYGGKYLVDNLDICPNKYQNVISLFTFLTLVLGLVNFSPTVKLQVLTALVLKHTQAFTDCL